MIKLERLKLSKGLSTKLKEKHDDLIVLTNSGANVPDSVLDFYRNHKLKEHLSKRIARKIHLLRK